MADIAMCQHQTCPARNHCYRATATPDPHRQAYQVFTPEVIESVLVCDGLWIQSIDGESVDECKQTIDKLEGKE